MTINPVKGIQISVFVDANWASDRETKRRSRTVLMVLYGNAVILTSSTTQKSISLSFMESEYAPFPEISKIIK